jgi:large subunit ribosomal protein L35
VGSDLDGSVTLLHWFYPRNCRKLTERKSLMPKQKLKTNKAMAKRVKVTAGGKFIRRKVGINHLRRNKSAQLVRSADKGFELKTADTRRLKRLLPYAF